MSVRASLCVPGHVGRGGEVIWYKTRLQSFERVLKARGKLADDAVNVDIINAHKNYLIWVVLVSIGIKCKQWLQTFA